MGSETSLKFQRMTFFHYLETQKLSQITTVLVMKVKVFRLKYEHEISHPRRKDIQILKVVLLPTDR